MLLPRRKGYLSKSDITGANVTGERTLAINAKSR